jgi:hypothetical protein
MSTLDSGQRVIESVGLQFSFFQLFVRLSESSCMHVHSRSLNGGRKELMLNPSLLRLGQASYRAVHQFFFTSSRSVYILVLDLTGMLQLTEAERMQKIRERMEFWVDSLQARTTGALVQVVLSKADLCTREEDLDALFATREAVRVCLEQLVTKHMTRLGIERQSLNGKTGAAEVRRWKELGDLLEGEARLKYPSSKSEIIVVGVHHLKGQRKCPMGAMKGQEATTTRPRMMNRVDLLGLSSNSLEAKKRLSPRKQCLHHCLN